MREREKTRFAEPCWRRIGGNREETKKEEFRMKKRLLSLFCALSLLLTLLPTGVFAVEAGNEEATAQAGDTGAVKVAAGAEWEELTLTPITASPDGGDLPVLFDDRDATAEWKENFGDQLETLLTDPLYTDATKTQGQVAKELYDALCDSNNLDKLKAGQPVSITLEQTNAYLASNSTEWGKEYDALNAHYTAYKGSLGSIVSSAVAAFDRDRSDIFWLGGSKTKCATAENGVLLNSADGSTFTPKENAIYSMQLEVTFDISNSWKAASDGGKDRNIADDTNTVTDAVVAIKAEAEKQTSRYNQLKAVHDWLTKNNAYNEAALKDTNKNADGGGYLDTTPWEAISALTTDKGLNPVCEGYARAFKLICDELDIPCVLVSGTAGSSDKKEPHMWNYVRMEDDQWYAVDVTWDDSVMNGSSGTSSGEGKDTYFLVGTDTQVDGKTTFSGNHNKSSNDFLTVGHAAFKYPALNWTKYVPKTSIAKAEIKLDSQQSVYAGEERTVKMSGVWLDDKKLSPNTDFRITGGNRATDVGDNTLTIAGTQRTGIAESSISDWKKKRTNPVSDKILIICEVLDVTPYELLSGAEYTGNRSRDNNTYVISKETEIGMLEETYQKIDINAQKRLIGYMEALKELS